MKRISPAGPTIKGFDVSHYQPGTNFLKMKAAGYNFCFLKATEGISYVDTSFKKFWVDSKNAGIVRGAYHFFHPKYDAKQQARFFVDTVGPLKKGDLPLVMDWETTDGTPAQQDLARGVDFVLEIKYLTGHIPIIYGSPYFLQALNLTSLFFQSPLWIAHYGVSAPSVPDPWKTWAFWQYSDNGLDYNLFNGNFTQLNALTVNS